MRDLELALDLVGLFPPDGAGMVAAGSVSSPFRAVAGQSDGTFARPCVVVTVKTRALDQGGYCLAFMASFMVLTDSEERDASNVACAVAKHAERVELVRATLFGSDAAGSAAAKAAVIASILEMEHFTLLGYDAGSGENGEMTVTSSAFETPVMMAGIVEVG